MKDVVFAEKSFLVGDDAAEVLLRYAAVLAEQGAADTVEMRASDGDGDVVTVTLLLNPGTPLMTEASASTAPEPDNADVVAYMRQRIDHFTTEHPAAPVDDGPSPSYDDLSH